MTMWTRLLLLLLWGSFASNVLAQKTGMILIVSPGGIGSNATRLLNAIKPHYPGPIGLDTKIPQDFSEIDALMLLRPNGAMHDSWLDSLQQARLIEYVKAGGRYYAEGADFRNWSGADSDTADNQFWDFIGDTSESVGAMERSVTSVVGVAGEFTEGFSITESTMAQVGSWFMLDGMKTVLRGKSVFGSGADMAWISPDPSIKAILHWPIAKDYYDAFLAQVVCNYFNLCSLHVSNRADAVATIAFDPIRSELHLPGAGAITISDILGREIMTATSQSSLCLLPSDLAKGSYIVLWQSGPAQASTTISVF